MVSISLPRRDGSLRRMQIAGASRYGDSNAEPFGRVAYAAAHVVTNPLSAGSPWRDSSVDLEATMAFRRHLWGLGFRVAEVMDTAQRGMGLPWPLAQDVMRRTAEEVRATPGAQFGCGVGTDSIEKTDASLDEILGAYEQQLALVEDLGATPIIMASRHLARAAKGPDDYFRIYDRLIGQTRGKVILHWLGEAFDPALAGYWGIGSQDGATRFVLDLIVAQQERVEGIKVSLLDRDHEVSMRARLPEGVAMYTGDDFNYPELIAGDGATYSHALLGIFDPIAPAAAAALVALGKNDADRFREILDPTLPLARHIFEAPTQYYKAGVVFLAWLNGHQDHFSLLAGMESARGILHYARLFELAYDAGVLRDTELAVARMKNLLSVHGVDA